MKSIFARLLSISFLLLLVCLAACSTVRNGSATAGVTKSFIATGSLTTARIGHTATLLSNGSVLISGGSRATKWSEKIPSEHNLASAEIYNPATENWTETGSLAVARDNHTATLLPTGKVLVTGGANGTYEYNKGIVLATAELYDPATGNWTATGSMTKGREGHTATLLPNGKVLVTGGYTAYESLYLYGRVLSSAELYDPAAGTWIETGSLAEARFHHTATLLSNGKVLVTGGYSAWGAARDNKVLATAELYDPVTGTWTATGSLADVRENYTATLLPNGKVLVTGGGGEGKPDFLNKYLLGYSKGAKLLSSSELYDPKTGTWTFTGSLAVARQGHEATLLSDGRVLVTGGSQNNFLSMVRNIIFECDSCSSDPVFSSAEIYEPVTGTWTATGSLATARRSHTATLLSNGNVLVSGGVNEVGFTASAEIYKVQP